MPIDLTQAPAPRATRLDNGLRVQCVQTPAPAPGLRGVVALQLWVRGGTADERDDEHGCAHFLEHMVFRPWASEPGCDLANAIEALGGEVNAYTSHDETVFHVTVPTDTVAPALAALKRAVLEPRLRADEFAREREVIIEEVRQYADDPGALVADHSLARTYPEHPYGRQILGRVGELRALEPSKLRAFHRRVYVGERLALVAVGPISRAKIMRLAKQELGGFRPGRSAPREPSAVDAAQGSFTSLAIPGVDVELRLSWTGPAIETDEAVALDLLAVVMGQGDAARLITDLRRARGLVHDVHANYLVGARAGTFIMSATCEPMHGLEALGAMLDARREIEIRRPRTEEIDRARAMLRASLVYRRETVQGQAHALGYYLTVAGDPGLERAYFRELDRLGPDELVAVAQRHLDASHMHVCAGLPRDGFDEDERRRWTAQAKSMVGSHRRAAKKSKREVPAWRRPKPELWCRELSCGMRIRLLRRDDLPMAAGWLAWRGGQRAERESEAGLGQLTTSLLGRGTESRDALSVASWLDTRAAVLDGFFGRGSAGLQFEATSDAFDSLLELAFESAMMPRFDPTDVARERDSVLDDLRAEIEDPTSSCIRTALRTLYGAHPYARPLRGQASVVRAATPEALREFWRRQRPEDAVLVIAGDIDPDLVVNVAEAAVARWPKGRRVAMPKLDWRPPERSSRRSRRRRNIQQAQLVHAYPAFGVGDPREAALELMVEILSSQSGCLFQALREREGLVYHVGVGATAGIGAGHLLVHAAAGAGHFDRASAALEQELERFVAAGPSAEELARAKGTLLGHLERSGQRRGRLAASMALAELHRGDALAAWAWPERISEVSLEQVREVSRAILSGPRVVSHMRQAQAPTKLKT